MSVREFRTFYRKAKGYAVVRKDIYLARKDIHIVKEILERVAQKPRNAYEISKIAPKLDRITVMRKIKNYGLVETGYLRAEKGKRNAIRYSIALKGILFIVHEELKSVEVEEWNKLPLNRLLVKHGSLLPLVFGKWNQFEKMSVGKMALMRLDVIANSLDKGTFNVGDATFPGQTMEEKITWFFYFFGIYPIEWEGWAGVEDPKAWIKAWKEDREIREYVSDKLEEEQRRLKNANAFVAKALAFLSD